LEHQVAVEHLDPLGQEPAHALVPLAVPQGTERRLGQQLLDAVLRRDASCGPYEKHSPGVGQVGQQAFEQGLAEEPGRAGDQDAPPGEGFADPIPSGRIGRHPAILARVPGSAKACDSGGSGVPYPVNAPAPPSPAGAGAALVAQTGQ
jgi:hypothetical protein